MSNLGLGLVNTAIMDLHQTIQNTQQSNETIPIIVHTKTLTSHIFSLSSFIRTLLFLIIMDPLSGNHPSNNQTPRYKIFLAQGPLLPKSLKNLKLGHTQKPSSEISQGEPQNYKPKSHMQPKYKQVEEINLQLYRAHTHS